MMLIVYAASILEFSRNEFRGSEMNKIEDEPIGTEKCEQINVDANCAALSVILLSHIKQHLVSEKIISAQEIAAFASALDNIQHIHNELATRYGIKPKESCNEVKIAIADAFNKIEMDRQCCG